MSDFRILLVDDEISSAEVIGLILSQEGYRVTLAADGRQALERLATAAPQLLITDFMMPVLNGAELVRAVRALPGYAALPVLLMSGAPEAALRPYQLTYEAFLRKPFTLEQFLQTVRRLRELDTGTQPSP
ncbi:response regulator [Ramlibacter sp. AN1015]|uniref:response regulator n=1 Tax=Ramlibacter sp. AN1015 TaxID=3133428 RepID=UPI0030C3BD3C